MRLPVVRALADWLDDPTHGVAARLATLTLDSGDTRPSTTLTVVDETRNASAAVDRFDDVDLPALLVTAVEVEHRDPEFQLHTDRADAIVRVVVRYAERTDEGATAITNGYYVLKATIAAMRAWMAPAYEAERTRVGVRVIHCESLRELALYEQNDDTWLIGTIEGRYYCTDSAPLGD
jgi:hypothetical protein